MEKQNIKAVVFDMDGVIFDSEVKVIECWKEIAEIHNIADIENFCITCMGQNREAAKQKFLEIYGADQPYDDYKKEMSDLFHKRYGQGRLPIKPGAEEILKYLRNKGYQLAIASSTRKALVEEELKNAGLLSYFHKVVGGDMVTKSKPDPEIFEMACAELSVPVEQAVAIEDSHNGIRAAKAAGMHPIMIPDQMPVTDEMKELAVYIYDNLLQLREIL